MFHWPVEQTQSADAGLEPAKYPTIRPCSGWIAPLPSGTSTKREHSVARLGHAPDFLEMCWSALWARLEPNPYSKRFCREDLLSAFVSALALVERSSRNDLSRCACEGDGFVFILPNLGGWSPAHVWREIGPNCAGDSFYSSALRSK